MATPKKKHLIELMIEAGVEWPEGAEYAAQDKRTMKVNFYRNGKPNIPKGENEWLFNHCNFMSSYGLVLPSLCRNWHQTIVTREQYAEAVAAANTSGKPNQVRESEDVGPYAIPENTESLTVNLVPQNGFYKLNGTPETPVDAVEWHNPPSIEQLTADYYAKAAEADRLQAVADEALKAADDALLALEKAGELLGLVISIDTKPKQEEPPVEPEQPVITDWRDLRVGDVVEYVNGTVGTREGKQGEICEIDESDHHNRVRVMFNKNEDERFWCSKWRFIRRP